MRGLIQVSDVKTRIETAKNNLRKAEQARTVAETNLANAEQQRDDVVKQMLDNGVTPETIADEIAKLETAVESDLQQVESLMPVGV